MQSFLLRKIPPSQKWILVLLAVVIGFCLVRVGHQEFYRQRGAFHKHQHESGAYYSVLAKLGKSYQAADVFLPGKADIVVLDADHHLKPSQDTVFVYMTGHAINGGWVDAGFQYSPVHDDWSLFMGVEQCGYTHGSAPGGATYARFIANQAVHLDFTVVAPDVVEVCATGTDLTGHRVTHRIRMDISRYPLTKANLKAGLVGKPTHYGWNPTGRGNRLGRAVSIAQAIGRADYPS